MVEAEESEEVGVEHLLRDVPSAMSSLADTSTPTTATLDHLLRSKHAALETLDAQLATLHGYLARVDAGAEPLDHGIAQAVQEMLMTMRSAPITLERLTELCNEMQRGIVLGELVRSVQALHDSIDAKLAEQARTPPLPHQTAVAVANAGSS